MANYCSTQLTFQGAKELISKLDSLITEWVSRDNGRGNEWLGNIVIGSGIGDWHDCDECRGEIVSKEFLTPEEPDDPAQLVVNQETAWTPEIELWREVLNKYFPEDKVFMFCHSSEPGCGIYQTNDDSYVDNYFLDDCKFGNYEEYISGEEIVDIP